MSKHENTTAYCEILDKGMVSILTKRGPIISVKLTSKKGDFELRNLEKVNEKNLKIFYSILESRTEYIKKTLIHFLNKNKGESHLVFGTRTTNVTHTGLGFYLVESEDIVLLYSPSLKFLPGICYKRVGTIIRKEF